MSLSSDPAQLREGVGANTEATYCMYFWGSFDMVSDTIEVVKEQSLWKEQYMWQK